MSKPTILIAGGYGLVGTHIARLLRAAAPDAELLLAGRHPAQGAALASELGGARTLRLDISQGDAALHALPAVDLVVSALRDAGNLLLDHALRTEAAHVSISQLASEILPAIAATWTRPPSRPVVLASTWQAGVAVWMAADLARRFRTIERVHACGVYDLEDPVGPMSAAEIAGFDARAQLREQGLWLPVNPAEQVREVEAPTGERLPAVPLDTLDMSILAAITGAPDVRFDMATGRSLGRSQGGAASHDVVLELIGAPSDSADAHTRTRIVASASDPRGNAHFTALGVAACALRALGLDGHGSAPAGGLYTPDTLVPAAQALQRLRAGGVAFTETVTWLPSARHALQGDAP